MLCLKPEEMLNEMVNTQQMVPCDVQRYDETISNKRLEQRDSFHSSTQLVEAFHEVLMCKSEYETLVSCEGWNYNEERIWGNTRTTKRKCSRDG